MESPMDNLLRELLETPISLNVLTRKAQAGAEISGSMKPMLSTPIFFSKPPWKNHRRLVNWLLEKLTLEMGLKPMLNCNHVSNMLVSTQNTGKTHTIYLALKNSVGSKLTLQRLRLFVLSRRWHHDRLQWWSWCCLKTRRSTGASLVAMGQLTTVYHQFCRFKPIKPPKNEGVLYIYIYIYIYTA